MKRFLTILLFIALTGCNFPTPQIAPAENSSAPCAYAEGRKDVAAISATLSEKLKAAALPVETARAEAYGENCIAADNTIVRFAQREIDFYVTLTVNNLKDEASLGSQLEQVVTVIDQLPPDQTGPNPGYVGLAFRSGDQTQNLWFTLAAAIALRNQKTKGADLYRALLKTP